ncbi:prohibitin family protein [bacterium]|nr:prohibitin family protein [candidate division CSSED10-310 bacterium]
MKPYRLFEKIGFAVILAGFLVTMSGCMIVSTGTTEVGVRTKKLGPSKGIEQKVYAPGSTYFFFPIINDFHTFDTRLVNMEMTYESGRGDRNSKDDLLFKTIDGNDISLDVIISYKIDPAKAPKILENIARSDEELKDVVMRTVARSRTRDIFGELRTEEFYVTNRRDEKAMEAAQILNDMLNPYGVIVERIMTRDYRFNTAYQKAIEDKKIADQLAEKNKSATRAATEEYLKKLEEAKGEVSKMKAQVDGEFRQAQINADAYFGKQEKLAEAIRAEGRAEARGIEVMNKALSGSGGEVMVKLEIAKALQNKRIILLPTSGGGIDLRTLDVNQLLGISGVQKLSQP